MRSGLSCRPVSVTLVYCIKTAEDIVKLLFRPRSPIVLVTGLHAPISNSKGNLVSVGAIYIELEMFFFHFTTEITIYLGNGTR